MAASFGQTLTSSLEFLTTKLGDDKAVDEASYIRKKHIEDAWKAATFVAPWLKIFSVSNVKKIEKKIDNADNEIWFRRYRSSSNKLPLNQDLPLSTVNLFGDTVKIPFSQLFINPQGEMTPALAKAAESWNSLEDAQTWFITWFNQVFLALGSFEGEKIKDVPPKPNQEKLLRYYNLWLRLSMERFLQGLQGGVNEFPAQAFQSMSPEYYLEEYRRPVTEQLPVRQINGQEVVVVPPNSSRGGPQVQLQLTNFANYPEIQAAINASGPSEEVFNQWLFAVLSDQLGNELIELNPSDKIYQYLKRNYQALYITWFRAVINRERVNTYADGQAIEGLMRNSKIFNAAEDHSFDRLFANFYGNKDLFVPVPGKAQAVIPFTQLNQAYFKDVFSKMGAQVGNVRYYFDKWFREVVMPRNGLSRLDSPNATIDALSKVYNNVYAIWLGKLRSAYPIPEDKFPPPISLDFRLLDTNLETAVNGNATHTVDPLVVNQLIGKNDPIIISFDAAAIPEDQLRQYILSKFGGRLPEGIKEEALTPLIYDLFVDTYNLHEIDSEANLVPGSAATAYILHVFAKYRKAIATRILAMPRAQTMRPDVARLNAAFDAINIPPPSMMPPAGFPGQVIDLGIGLNLNMSWEAFYQVENGHMKLPLEFTPEMKKLCSFLLIQPIPLDTRANVLKINKQAAHQIREILISALRAAGMTEATANLLYVPGSPYHNVLHYAEKKFQQLVIQQVLRIDETKTIDYEAAAQLAVTGATSPKLAFSGLLSAGSAKKAKTFEAILDDKKFADPKATALEIIFPDDKPRRDFTLRPAGTATVDYAKSAAALVKRLQDWKDLVNEYQTIILPGLSPADQTKLQDFIKKLNTRIQTAAKQVLLLELTEWTTAGPQRAQFETQYEQVIAYAGDNNSQANALAGLIKMIPKVPPTIKAAAVTVLELSNEVINASVDSLLPQQEADLNTAGGWVQIEARINIELGLADPRDPLDKLKRLHIIVDPYYAYSGWIKEDLFLERVDAAQLNTSLEVYTNIDEKLNEVRDEVKAYILANVYDLNQLLNVYNSLRGELAVELAELIETLRGQALGIINNTIAVSSVDKNNIEEIITRIEGPRTGFMFGYGGGSGLSEMLRALFKEVEPNKVTIPAGFVRGRGNRRGGGGFGGLGGLNPYSPNPFNPAPPAAPAAPGGPRMIFNRSGRRNPPQQQVNPTANQGQQPPQQVQQPNQPPPAAPGTAGTFNAAPAQPYIIVPLDPIFIDDFNRALQQPIDQTARAQVILNHARANHYDEQTISRLIAQLSTGTYQNMPEMQGLIPMFIISMLHEQASAADVRRVLNILDRQLNIIPQDKVIDILLAITNDAPIRGYAGFNWQTDRPTRREVLERFDASANLISLLPLEPPAQPQAPQVPSVDIQASVEPIERFIDGFSKEILDLAADINISDRSINTDTLTVLATIDEEELTDNAYRDPTKFVDLINVIQNELTNIYVKLNNDPAKHQQLLGRIEALLARLQELIDSMPSLTESEQFAQIILGLSPAELAKAQSIANQINPEGLRALNKDISDLIGVTVVLKDSPDRQFDYANIIELLNRIHDAFAEAFNTRGSNNITPAAGAILKGQEGELFRAIEAIRNITAPHDTPVKTDSADTNQLNPSIIDSKYIQQLQTAPITRDGAIEILVQALAEQGVDILNTQALGSAILQIQQAMPNKVRDIFKGFFLVLVSENAADDADKINALQAISNNLAQLSNVPEIASQVTAISKEVLKDKDIHKLFPSPDNTANNQIEMLNAMRERNWDSNTIAFVANSMILPAGDDGKSIMSPYDLVILLEFAEDDNLRNRAFRTVEALSRPDMQGAFGNVFTNTDFSLLGKFNLSTGKLNLPGMVTALIFYLHKGNALNITSYLTTLLDTFTTINANFPYYVYGLAESVSIIQANQLVSQQLAPQIKQAALNTLTTYAATRNPAIKADNASLKKHFRGQSILPKHTLLVTNALIDIAFEGPAGQVELNAPATPPPAPAPSTSPAPTPASSAPTKSSPPENPKPVAPPSVPTPPPTINNRPGTNEAVDNNIETALSKFESLTSESNFPALIAAWIALSPQEKESMKNQADKFNQEQMIIACISIKTNEWPQLALQIIQSGYPMNFEAITYWMDYGYKLRDMYVNKVGGGILELNYALETSITITELASQLTQMGGQVFVRAVNLLTLDQLVTSAITISQNSNYTLPTDFQQFQSDYMKLISNNRRFLLFDKIDQVNQMFANVSQVYSTYIKSRKGFGTNTEQTLEKRVDYYQVLGVSSESTPRQIKAAYYKLAKRYSPPSPEANEVRMLEINEAYEILSNPEKRAKYDDRKSLETSPEEQERNLFIAAIHRIPDTAIASAIGFAERLNEQMPALQINIQLFTGLRNLVNTMHNEPNQYNRNLLTEIQRAGVAIINEYNRIAPIKPIDVAEPDIFRTNRKVIYEFAKAIEETNKEISTLRKL